MNIIKMKKWSEDGTSVTVSADEWNKIMAVVEAAKELGKAITPALRKPERTYPGDKLNEALKELEGV